MREVGVNSTKSIRHSRDNDWKRDNEMKTTDSIEREDEIYEEDREGGENV